MNSEEYNFSELAQSIGVGEITFDIKPSWQFIDCSCGKVFERKEHNTTWCDCGSLLSSVSVQQLTTK